MIAKTLSSYPRHRLSRKEEKEPQAGAPLPKILPGLITQGDPKWAAASFNITCEQRNPPHILVMRWRITVCNGGKIKTPLRVRSKTGTVLICAIRERQFEFDWGGGGSDFGGFAYVFSRYEEHEEKIRIYFRVLVVESFLRVHQL
jgi:hypothetical protein